MTSHSFLPTGTGRAESSISVDFDKQGLPILQEEKDLIFHDSGLLGSGGFGTCYLAKQRSLDRFVAVKFLHEKYSGDSRFVDRFKAEIKTLAKCQHPTPLKVVYRN